MLAKEYAQALTEVIAEGVSSASAVKNLLLVLKSRGHEKLLPRIVRELERREERASGKGVLVRTADEKSRKEALHKAHALSEEYALDTAAIRVAEDPTLISGYAIEGPGFRFDTSARAALLNLYRHLKTN